MSSVWAASQQLRLIALETRQLDSRLARGVLPCGSRGGLVDGLVAGYWSRAIRAFDELQVVHFSTSSARSAVRIFIPCGLQDRPSQVCIHEDLRVEIHP